MADVEAFGGSSGERSTSTSLVPGSLTGRTLVGLNRPAPLL
jgi:hypothetical protein